MSKYRVDNHVDDNERFEREGPRKPWDEGTGRRPSMNRKPPSDRKGAEMVQRFHFNEDYCGFHNKGEYVRHDDYQTLATRLRELEAKLAAVGGRLNQDGDGSGAYSELHRDLFAILAGEGEGNV